ncbi:MAG: hypothetical protein DHS20C18_51880 [Saprospiraceae bacterium]|nr:MAG: hypothetical protein DHS20C18_51880 [Saprospiraceae bacterium]
MIQPAGSKKQKEQSHSDKKGQRLRALDIFRGLTVAAMILVNNPGDWSTVYPPLLHTKWNGCTIADLIFPFFLFIVGLSISLALGNQLRQGKEKPAIAFKIIRRSILIFSLGVFLAAFPNFGFSDDHVHLTIHYFLLSLVILAVFFREIAGQNQFDSHLFAQRWRTALGYFVVGTISILFMLTLSGFLPYSISHLHLPGVLQRIAIVYACGGLLFLYTPWRIQLSFGIGILLLYWMVMMVIPVPGYGHANLDPVHNMATWTDRFMINSIYFWVTGHSHHWTEFHLGDPEGFLSTIPAITTAIIGILAGKWLTTRNSNYKKVTGILAVGAILVFMGLFWDLEFPINKKLWSSSYVLYTGGIALLVFGIIYWLEDILGYLPMTKPAVVFGTNALFIYLFSEMINHIVYTIAWVDASGHHLSLQSWLYQTFYHSWLPAYRASLLYSLTYVFFFWVCAWILYRKKIFIKV